MREPHTTRAFRSEKLGAGHVGPGLRPVPGRRPQLVQGMRVLAGVGPLAVPAVEVAAQTHLEQGVGSGPACSKHSRSHAVGLERMRPGGGSTP